MCISVRIHGRVGGCYPRASRRVGASYPAFPHCTAGCCAVIGSLSPRSPRLRWWFRPLMAQRVANALLLAALFGHSATIYSLREFRQPACTHTYGGAFPSRLLHSISPVSGQHWAGHHPDHPPHHTVTCYTHPPSHTPTHQVNKHIPHTGCIMA